MGKKLMIAAVGGFVIFYILLAPQDSAELVRGILDALGTAFDRLLEFLRNLL